MTFPHVFSKTDGTDNELAYTDRWLKTALPSESTGYQLSLPEELAEESKIGNVEVHINGESLHVEVNIRAIL